MSTGRTPPPPSEADASCKERCITATHTHTCANARAPKDSTRDALLSFPAAAPPEDRRSIANV